jgi:hypothetical protein
MFKHVPKAVFEFDKVLGIAIQCGHFDQSVCFHKVVFVEIVQLQLFKITCHCRISRVLENSLVNLLSTNRSVYKA